MLSATSFPIQSFKAIDYINHTVERTLLNNYTSINCISGSNICIMNKKCIKDVDVLECAYYILLCYLILSFCGFLFRLVHVCLYAAKGNKSLLPQNKLQFGI